MATKYTKQKDGRYRTKVFLKEYTDEGRPKYKYLSATTQKELDEKVYLAHQEIEEGRKRYSSDTLFLTYATNWLDVYKSTKSKGTRDDYRYTINSKLKPLHNLKLTEITRSDIQEVVNVNAHMPKTCIRIKLTLKQIFASAIDDHIIKESPYVKIELPKYRINSRRALTQEEKDAIKNCNFTLRQKAFVYTLLGTGMRPAEMFALTWDDINFKNQTISITKALDLKAGKGVLSKTKTEFSVRTIEVSDFVVNILLEYKAVSKYSILFCNVKGEYQHKWTYDSEWSKIKALIIEQLGHNTPITPYYFRHNFATILYYSNVSLKEAQRLLGHADLSMLMKIYAHLDAKKENTKQKLNNINFLS